MDDQDLSGALVALVQAAAKRRPTDTAASWCHYDPDGVVESTCDLLLADERIARNCAPGMMLWLATGGGTGLGLNWALPNFISAAEAGDPQSEARTFLDLLRLKRGSVPVEVATTLVGLKLPESTTLELPFGRLRMAQPTEIVGTPRGSQPRPAAIFTFETEVQGAVSREPAFDGPHGDAARDAARRAYDERMTRMLLALVLTQEAPVQEHLVTYRARYADSGQGINVPPLAPWVTDWPYSLESGPEVEKLREYAGLIARIDVRRLAVPTRRYLLARAERIRPEDEIVDYATALEAISGGQKGRARTGSIAALVGGNSPHLAAGAEATAKAVADARNAILHNGAVPADAPAIAREARTLVRRAIEAAVRRELHGIPAHPAWANIHPDALDHVRAWDPRRWHSGAAQTHSSQALCVSVFGALAADRRRGSVIAEIVRRAGVTIAMGDGSNIVCEDAGRPELLGEHGTRTTPTSVDVLVTSSGGVIAIESKFLETGFGMCSQPKAGYCSGDFASGSDLKTETAAPCRLMEWDGDRSPRTYWDIAAAVFRPAVIAPPQRPCPFAGPSFQLMRNLCFAAALAQKRRKPRGYAFVVAYVAASPSAPAIERELTNFRQLLLDEAAAARVGLISYEEIAGLLRDHGENTLADFIDRRLSDGIATAAR